MAPEIKKLFFWYDAANGIKITETEPEDRTWAADASDLVMDLMQNKGRFYVESTSLELLTELESDDIRLNFSAFNNWDVTRNIAILKNVCKFYIEHQHTIK